MKKSDWAYLAKAMWKYAEQNTGKVSRLLKELIIEINESEMIENDMDEFSKINGSDRPSNSNSTGPNDFNGTGEF